VAATVDLLGGLAYEMGDYQTAVAQHGRAAAAFRALGHRVHEALALNNLGAAYWGLGAYAASRAAHEQALAINRAINHRRGEADNLDNMGGVDWVLGRYDEAIALYEAALAIRRAIADQWGISISLGNLGSAYRLKGAYDTALSYLDEAYALNVKMGRRRGQCYNLHARGLTLLAQERVAEARAALEEALTGRSALGERDNLLQTKAALLRCAVAAAEQDTVAQLRHDLAAALAAQSCRASLRQEIHFACYEADRFLGQPAEAALLAAQRALEEIAAPLTEAERSHFLRAVPHNQALLGAVAAYATVQSVQLPARGRRGHVNVRWTVAALEDHAVPGRAARRRTVLARLLAEARTQGADPAAAELADALGVSRRTILRDLRRLSGSTTAD
jgi:tetratricopeptide (TPR) repeat protein